jgi:hypothetical protein
VDSVGHSVFSARNSTRYNWLMNLKRGTELSVLSFFCSLVYFFLSKGELRPYNLQTMILKNSHSVFFSSPSREVEVYV